MFKTSEHINQFPIFRQRRVLKANQKHLIIIVMLCEPQRCFSGGQRMLNHVFLLRYFASIYVSKKNRLL